MVGGIGRMDCGVMKGIVPAKCWEGKRREDVSSGGICLNVVEIVECRGWWGGRQGPGLTAIKSTLNQHKL